MTEDKILKHKMECSIPYRKEMDVKFEKRDDKISAYAKEVTSLKGDFKLTNQVVKMIQSDVKEIKETLKEFINKADEKYATKKEHDINKEKIKKIENGVWWVIGLIGSILITTIIYSIIK